jgi:hypothetical protein
MILLTCISASIIIFINHKRKIYEFMTCYELLSLAGCLSKKDRQMSEILAKQLKNSSELLIRVQGTLGDIKLLKHLISFPKRLIIKIWKFNAEVEFYDLLTSSMLFSELDFYKRDALQSSLR